MFGSDILIKLHPDNLIFDDGNMLESSVMVNFGNVYPGIFRKLYLKDCYTLIIIVELQPIIVLVLKHLLHHVCLLQLDA